MWTRLWPLRARRLGKVDLERGRGSRVGKWKWSTRLGLDLPAESTGEFSFQLHPAVLLYEAVLLFIGQVRGALELEAGEEL